MSLRVTSIIVLTLLLAIAAAAQVSQAEFRKLLRDRVGFQDADLSALDSGQTVIKILPANDKREIAVCGVTRLGKVSELTLAAFREAITTSNNKAVLADGKFSSPPVVEDLQSLKLEDRDIEELRRCEPGKCDIKISAEMISKMHFGVDWDAPDYRERASQLFSTILVEYMRAYLLRGDKALIQIDSRKVPVSLPDENREMLERVLFIKEFAPEFRKYLSDYPRYQLSDVDTGLLWSKISTGIKPIVTVTQTSAYANFAAGLPQFTVAAKQIFATRYIESSLAFTYLVSFPGNDTAETYLVFTSLSKSDALAGAFGDVKRTLVSNETTNRVQDLLQRAKFRLEAKDRPGSISQADPGMLSVIWDIVRSPVFLIFLTLSLAAIFLFVVRRSSA